MTTTRRRPQAPTPEFWELLRTSIADLPDGLGLLDLDGRLRFLNPEGAQLLGLTETSNGRPGSAWRRHLKPEAADRELPMLRSLRGEHIREEIIRLETPDAAPRRLGVSASPLLDASGARRGSVFRFRDVTAEWTRLQESARELARRLKQRQALLELLRFKGPADADLRETLRDVVRLVGKILDVDRCGIWLLSEDGRRLHCAALHDRDGKRAEDEPSLEAARHPAYLAAVSEKEAMPIEDVAADARARELRASYLTPRRIRAMLDAPLFVDGRLRGVLCNEHVGEARTWADDERTFCIAVASDTARVIGDWERRQVDVALRAREREIETLEERSSTDTRFSRLATRSSSMADAIRRLRLAAKSDVILLIRGESGTGKELAARAVHAHSARRDRPFEAVNCAALPPNLLESELFGHVKGAFTGATRDHAGLFRQAHRGTLFLDEIGELPPILQAKVLRALQEREIRPVGGTAALPVDVRIIAATNRDLEQDLAEGRLREDFYYRVRVFEVVLPPLRDRLEDLPALTGRILQELTRPTGRRVTGLEPAAMRILESYRWPGNVRELRNALEHALVSAPGDRIRVEDLPVLSGIAPGRRPGPVAARQDPAQTRVILEALQAEKGHRGRAAARLGISRVTLWHRMKELGLES